MVKEPLCGPMYTNVFGFGHMASTPEGMDVSKKGWGMYITHHS